jgi:hypothetical protein
VELNAVLSRRILARETETYGIGPAVTCGLPMIEADNARALREIRAKDAWRDTVDPAADQLASDVVREMGRGNACP